MGWVLGRVAPARRCSRRRIASRVGVCICLALLWLSASSRVHGEAPQRVEGGAPASGSGAEIEARVQAGRAALARGAYAEAAAHLKPAAEAGHVGAQLELAGLYADGLGVMRSEAAASAWYARALLAAAAAGSRAQVVTAPERGGLSAVAAAALVPTGPGTGSTAFAIVVAAAQSADAARAAWEELRQKHGTALAAVMAARPGDAATPVPLLQAVETPSHGRLHRVVLSGFATTDSAAAACEALRRAGLACSAVAPG